MRPEVMDIMEAILPFTLLHSTDANRGWRVATLGQRPIAE